MSGVVEFHMARQSSGGEPRATITESNADTRLCSICRSDLPKKKFVSLSECNDQYCLDCTVPFLLLSTESIRSTHKPIMCPSLDCPQKLCFWKCAEIIEPYSKKAADDFRTVPIMQTIAERKHSSNPRCNVTFDYTSNGEENCTDVTCPLCNRVTCVKCNSEYHRGKSCEEADGEADLTVRTRQREWKHCPGCNQLIERSAGCKQWCVVVE